MISGMPTKEGVTELCKRCGKTPRSHYAGYCADCADTLELRGLLAPLPGQSADEAQADRDTESMTDDKGP